MGSSIRHITLLATLSVCSIAAAGPRMVTPLDAGWRFAQGDPEGAEAAAFDDTAWAPVSLPHDWAIAGPFDVKARAGGAGGFLPTGVAWYRKTFNAKPIPGRRLFVELDGVMERSGVWINGHHLGHRPNGYVGLRYDLTPFLRTGGPNVLAVRADTEAAPSSRWYAGSGIYRHVRLIETGDVHVDQGGAFARVTALDADRATVRVGVDVINDGTAARPVRLEAVITGPDGAEAARLVVPAVAVAVGRVETLSGDLTLAKPRRWDLSDPALYKASLRVVGADGAALDEETVAFGVRDARFEAATGFWLNGRNLKLKGVALHADGGAVGAAVPLAVWRQRLTALKALGVNAVRTAHNPPSPEFLDLTDELGLVVMDELFDMWNVAKTPADYHLFFSDWSKRDARDIIRRDRNHPSIVLWSVGNEIHDTAYPVQAKAALKSLLDVVHANDPSRPATMALFRPNVTGDYQNGLADMLDVVGQNYRETELIAANQQNPNRKIVGTENGHNRVNWTPVRDYAPYAGMFLWTGVDYLGESDRSGWPNIQNPAGLLDRTGLVKVSGLQRDSWWNEKPVVHVVRNSTPAAPGPATDGAGPTPTLPTMIAVATPAPRAAVADDWTPENLAPHPETIEVYSNCQSVEVTLNGRSLGTKALPADASPRQWPVSFVPGTVTAQCLDAGQAAVRDSLRTAGPAARIALTSDAAAVGAAFDDLAFVRARVVDAEGVTVPRVPVTIGFKVSGSGVLVATDNGSSTDHTPFASPQRQAEKGRAVALVRGTAAGGTLRVEAAASGLKPGSLSLKVQAGRP
ncbi:MAG: beta-galactosidase [Caulobacter sp.]|nr:beta-galactosidase [Caulobacter sp.]